MKLLNTHNNPDRVSPISISGYWISTPSYQLSYISPTTSPSYVSRYQSTRLINKDGKIYQETYNRSSIQQTSRDQYHTVTFTEKNRLDIIAKQYYRFAFLWWVIAQANNIIDPFSVDVGAVLRIPPLDSLYTSGGVLSYNG